MPWTAATLFPPEILGGGVRTGSLPVSKKQNGLSLLSGLGSLGYSYPHSSKGT